MTSTSNLTVILIIILAIDLFLFLGQTAVNNLNPDSITRPEFYDYDSSFLHDFDSGGYTLNQSNPQLGFPAGEDSVSEEGTAYTDIFKSTKSWFLEATGLKYLLNFLGAPVVFLSALNLPIEITFGFGALWWGITLFLIIAFIFGRS